MNSKAIIREMGTQTSRMRFNSIRNMRPEYLSRALESFENGKLGGAARIFESILRRDDVICGLNLKRKKSVARLEGEVVVLEDSPRAAKHKKVLDEFYSSLKCENFADKNLQGGVKMLISQMMDCVGMKYSAHKVEFFESGGKIRGKFVQYPLWMFENTSGRLRLLEREGQLTPGDELDKNEWLIVCGDGLMFPSAIAYMFKELPLKDWLVYCERNGMPGIKAKTDAFPGSDQWNAACAAVADFGAEFHAVLSQGTDIEAIDVSTSGELPYPRLIERIDRNLCSLWRGADLGTMGGESKMGASLQEFESTLIEEDDALNISQTLNSQIDENVIRLSFGKNEMPLAKFRLKLPDYAESKYELEIIERLTALGLRPDAVELAARFAFPLARENEIPQEVSADLAEKISEESKAKELEEISKDAEGSDE